MLMVVSSTGEGEGLEDEAKAEEGGDVVVGVVATETIMSLINPTQSEKLSHFLRCKICD